MSKPKIYAFCDAGCKWETVHKSDFEKSASIIEVPKRDGYVHSYDLEKGKQYRIEGVEVITEFDEIVRQWSFTVTFDVYFADNGLIHCQIALPECDEYTDKLNLKWLDTVVSIGKDGATATFIYELNGERIRIEQTNASITDPETPIEGKEVGVVNISTEGLTRCYLYNEDAQIVAKDGVGIADIQTNGSGNGSWSIQITLTDGTTTGYVVKDGADGDDGDSVFIRYSANANGSGMSTKWTADKKYIGIATGTKAPTSYTAYAWSQFVGSPLPVVGHFANYIDANIRLQKQVNAKEYKVYIRKISADYVCVRFEHEQLKSDTASRILYLYLNADGTYMFQLNNDANKGYCWYGVEGGAAQDMGNTDWWWDYTNGYIEFKFDINAVGNIASIREFLIRAACLRDYNAMLINEVTQIYFNLDDVAESDTAELRTAMAAIAEATTIAQVRTAAKNYTDSTSGT